MDIGKLANDRECGSLILKSSNAADKADLEWLLQIPWLFPAEVNSLRFRTKGAALATACDWLSNYVRTVRSTFCPRALTSSKIVVQTTPPGIHYLKWGLYLVYAILNAAFVPLVYYLVVETSGRSLEDTDRWFEENPGWLVHRANHTIDRTGMNGLLGKTRGGLQIADDHESMMAAFQVAADDEDEVSSLDSPVTRRSSYHRLD